MTPGFLLGIIFAGGLAQPVAAADGDPLSKADRLFAERKFAAAAAAYKSALKNVPAAPAAMARYIRALLQTRRTKEALEAALDAQHSSPDVPELAELAGDASFQRNDFDHARSFYEHNLSPRRARARSYVGLGRIADSEFDRKTAAAMWRAAYALNPKDPEVLKHYASVAKPAADKIAVLRQYLEAAHGEDPNNLEAARLKIRYYEALGDRKTATLASPYTDYEIKLRESGNAVFVEASFNGSKPVRLLLDTGASGVLLSQAAARAAGMRAIAPAQVLGIGNLGLRAAETRLAGAMTLGSLTFRDIVALVTDSPSFNGHDGVIGTSIFERFLIRLDYRAKLLRLSPLPAAAPSECDPDQWCDMERRIPNEFSNFASVHRQEHILVVPVEVNGKATGHFAIDSGGFSTVVDAGFARKLAMAGKYDQTLVGITGLVKASTLAVVVLRIGTYRQTCRDVPAIDFSGRFKPGNPELDGVLGHNLLRKFILSIDYRDGLIELSKP